MLKLAKKLKQTLKDWSESNIFLKAITDTLLPKLSDDDIQVINSVLENLIPDFVSVSHDVHQLKSSAVQVRRFLKVTNVRIANNS